MFKLGYYNEFTFAQDNFFENNPLKMSQSLNFPRDQSTLDAHSIEHLLKFQVIF